MATDSRSPTLNIARGDLGSLEIRSRPGRGTQIVVRIPLEKQVAVA